MKGCSEATIQKQHRQRRAAIGLAIAIGALVVSLATLMVSYHATPKIAFTRDNWKELDKEITAAESVADEDDEIDHQLVTAIQETAREKERVIVEAVPPKEIAEQAAKITSLEQSAQLLKDEMEAKEEEIKGLTFSLNALQKEKEDILKRSEELTSNFADLGVEKEGLVKENGDLKLKLANLQGIQEQYAEEHRQHLLKEELLGQVANSLKEQKQWISDIDKVRNSQSEELIKLKQDYTELVQTSESTKTDSAPVSLDPTAARVHVIARGDTLTSISTQYYGTATKWQSIYEANKEVIPDKNKIKVGTTLVIP